MIWFISDTHFYHDNIVEYCNRPQNHDRIMWQNLKRLVGAEDTLIHLGDVVLGNRAVVNETVEQLPGNLKFLIAGNHDVGNKVQKAPGWTKVNNYKEIVLSELEGVRFAMSHRTCDLDDLEFEVDVILHGHIHDIGEPYYWRDNVLWINLCVEQWNYRPVSLKEILELREATSL